MSNQGYLFLFKVHLRKSAQKCVSVCPLALQIILIFCYIYLCNLLAFCTCRSKITEANQYASESCLGSRCQPTKYHQWFFQIDEATSIHTPKLLDILLTDPLLLVFDFLINVRSFTRCYASLLYQVQYMIYMVDICFLSFYVDHLIVHVLVDRILCLTAIYAFIT